MLRGNRDAQKVGLKAERLRRHFSLLLSGTIEIALSSRCGEVCFWCCSRGSIGVITKLAAAPTLLS